VGLLHVARLAAFWVGAVECLIGVLSFCFMGWIFLVLGQLKEPAALGMLALAAGGIALVVFVAAKAAESEQPEFLGGGLLVLVVLPLLAITLLT
jgi:hypothetical protein